MTATPITDADLADVKAGLATYEHHGTDADSRAQIRLGTLAGLVARLDAAEVRAALAESDRDTWYEVVQTLSKGKGVGMLSVEEWRAARAAFLALPPNSSDAKAALNRLASAEDALFNLKGVAP